MIGLTGVVALHLGKLHPYEHALVYLLAFGPILLLAGAIWISRRRDDREERERGRSVAERLAQHQAEE